jgi:hypothetical protein
MVMQADKYGSPEERRRFKAGWVSGCGREPSAPDHSQCCDNCRHSFLSGPRLTGLHCDWRNFATQSRAVCRQYEPEGQGAGQ